MPLFEAVVKHIPAPEYEAAAPLQAQVTNLDSPFVGRLALGRVHAGTIRKGAQVAVRDERRDRARSVTSSTSPRARARRGGRGGPGELVAVAGLPIEIGETVADPDHPHPLPHAAGSTNRRST